MTPEETPLPVASDGTEIRVVLARFEAKLDVALAHHGARIETHEREIADLRASDKETNVRLLALERTPTVTPRQLAVTVFGTVGAIGALSPFLERLYA